MSRRPFERLFAKTRVTPRSHQALDLTSTMTEGYDDLLEPQTADAPGRGTPALSSLLQTAVKYARQGRTLSLTMDSTGSVRYYPDFHHEVSPEAAASTTQDIRLGRSSTLSFNEAGSYQPFRWTNHIVEQTFVFAEPDAAPLVQVNDYTFETRQRIFTYNGGARFSTAVARATLALGYEFRRSTGDPALDLDSHRAFFRFTQPVTRHASLRLGYGERRVRFGGADAGGRAVKDHDMDVGVDVDQPISASRRTTIRFGSGSSITSVDGSTEFHLSGSASLRHEIGRTWSAQAQYMRGVQMLEGFAAPALTDTVNLVVEGFLAPRLKFSTSTSGQLGTIVTTTAGRFSRYDASTTLSFDVSRHASFMARYVAQQYNPRNAAASGFT